MFKNSLDDIWYGVLDSKGYGNSMFTELTVNLKTFFSFGAD